MIPVLTQKRFLIVHTQLRIHLKFLLVIWLAFLIGNISGHAQADITQLTEIEKLIEERQYKKAVEIYNAIKDNVPNAEKEQFIKLHELGAKAIIGKGIKDYNGSNQIYELLLDTFRGNERVLHWLSKIQHNNARLEKDANKKIAIYKELIDELPEDHIDLGLTYQLLGDVYRKPLRDYDNFLLFNEKALTAYGKSHGNKSYEYVRGLNYIGHAYKMKGQLTKAKKTWERAKRVHESNRNRVQKIIDQYSKIVNNLGGLYLSFNEFEKAESLITSSLKIKEKEGKNSAYAKTLYNYALLLNNQDRNQEALQKIEECIQIAQFEIAKGDELNYLQLKAGILVALDSLDGAIEIYEKLLTERIQIEQEKHPNHSKVLYNLFDLYVRTEKLEQAKQLIEKAITLFKEVHGESHPYYAKAIRKKADLMFEEGNRMNFDSIYTLSSKLVEKAYTKKHIEYFEAEFDYFLYLKKSNRDSLAIEKLLEIDKRIRNYIIKVASYVSPREITNLYRNYFQEMLSLASRHPNHQQLQRLVFDSSLFYKGFILQKILSVQKAIKNSEKLGDLSAQQKELQDKLDTAIEKEEVKNIVSYRRQIDELKTSFSKVDAFSGKEVNVEIVHDKLEETVGALDFIRYYDQDSLDHVYVAQILTSEAEIPIFVPLFKETEFTKFFDKNKSSNDLATILYGEPDRHGTPIRQNDKFSLYKKIWIKLAPHLDGIEKIYYSTDGILNNVAFHAISLEEDKVVADKFQLVQMTSLRNLVAEQETEYTAYKALLIGGVNYGEEDNGLADLRSSDMLYWPQLSNSSKEVDSIQHLLELEALEVEILKDYEPQKKLIQLKLRQGNDLRIIHFAVHGYFATDSLLGIRSEIRDNQVDIDLKRSALVLANANTKGEAAYLNAFEISECDLSTTQLVVLSACESGLGQVYQTEGVYGLQRAFKIAGVEYVIMSLWKIGDKNAKRFMERFYNYYLEDMVSVEEAFYQTQKELSKESGIDWAAFVLLK